MKIKKGFALRKVGNQYIAVAAGSELVNFDAMISTNETGAFLWNIFAEGADEAQAVSAMTAEYDIDEAQAAADVREFMKKLSDAGVCE